MANSYTRTLVEMTAAMSLIPKPAGVLAKHRSPSASNRFGLALDSYIHIFEYEKTEVKSLPDSPLVQSAIMFPITTKTARIWDSGREHRTAEVAPWPLVASALMSAWEGCIIVTIGLLDPCTYFGDAGPNSILIDTTQSTESPRGLEYVGNAPGLVLPFESFQSFR